MMVKKLTELKRKLAFFLVLVMLFDLDMTGFAAGNTRTFSGPDDVSYSDTIYWYYEDGSLEITLEKRETAATASIYHGTLDGRFNYDAETDPVPWDDLKGYVTSFSVVSSDDGAVVPYYMASWCDGMDNLEFVDFSGLDTCGTVDMSRLFRNCDLLTDVDMTGLNTEWVQSMEEMFSGCTQLTTLDLSELDTHRVTDFSYMFRNCENLTDADILNFSSDAATTVRGMFAGCSSLPEFTAGDGFTLQSVTDAGFMFAGCTGLETVDLSKLQLTALTNAESMFEDCSSLVLFDFGYTEPTQEQSVQQFVKTATMSSMFKNCSSLLAADFSKAAFSRLRCVDDMFEGCESLQVIDFSGQTMDTLRSASGMFRGCIALVAVTFPSLREADNLKNLSEMFAGCISLTDLSLDMNRDMAGVNVIEIDTSNVTDMSGMFADCSGLKKLSLDIDMTGVKNLDDMLAGCTGLISLTRGGRARLRLEDESGTVTSNSNLPDPDPMYVEGADGYWYRILESKVEQIKSAQIPLKITSGDKATHMAYFAKMTYDSNGYGETVTVPIMYTEDFVVAGNLFGIDRPTLDPLWRQGEDKYWKEGTVISDTNVKLGLADEVFEIRWEGEPKATCSVAWKNGEVLLEVQEVQLGLVPEYHGATPVKGSDAEGSYKFTGWDPEVKAVTEDTVYQAQFSKAFTVTWLYDDNTVFATESVAAGELPANPGIPEKPSAGGFDYIFEKWTGPDGELPYDPLEMPVWKDTVYKASFKKIASDWLYWKVEGDCLTISREPLSGGEMFRKDAMYLSFEQKPWFRYADSIRQVLFLWDQVHEESKVTPGDMTGWFEDLSNVKQFDFSGLNTSCVRSFERTFAGCVSLKNLDVSSFDTSSAETMSGMFRDAKHLRSLDLKKFNTENVVDFSCMFAGCCYLKEADVSGFNTEKAEDLGYMFENCFTLAKIDVSHFCLSASADLTGMFYKCMMITDLDLEGFVITKDNSVRMLTDVKRLKGFRVATVSDFSAANLPEPNKAFTEGAEGYWFDDQNAGYLSKDIKGHTVYHSVYGNVTFDPNGGEGEKIVETLHYSDLYFTLPTVDYSMEGKVFAGWSRTKGSGNYAEYEDRQVLLKGTDEEIKGFETLVGKTLYAVWTEPQDEYATVEWINADRKPLHKAKVKIGTVPVYPFEDPTIEETAQFTYTFKGWSPQPAELTAEGASYTAQYTSTVRTYTVTWYNGTQLLETDENVKYGTIPTYDNPAKPVKQETEYVYYEWTGWNPVIAPVTGNARYSATFTEKQKPVVTHYTITWLDSDGVTQLGQKSVKIGDMPELGFVPKKDPTERYTFEFSHWDPQLEKVSKEQTYRAVYVATKRIYTVTYDLQGHGSSMYRRERVDERLTKPTDPTSKGYEFLGWYLDQKGQQKLDFNSFTMPAGDLTVYALWKQNEVTPQPSSGGGGGGSVSTKAINLEKNGATFSPFWFSENGVWKIANRAGEVQKSCWLCDDAVISNRSDVWYLLRADGSMEDAGLVQDLTGNYYSLEMRHEGYYGMLRYQNGWYDGIWLEFESGHNGSFGAIKNKEGIEALKKKYGVTHFNIGNSNCVYTSSF